MDAATIITTKPERRQVCRVLEFKQFSEYINWETVGKTARELGAHVEARRNDRGDVTLTYFWTYDWSDDTEALSQARLEDIATVLRGAGYAVRLEHPGCLVIPHYAREDAWWWFGTARETWAADLINAEGESLDEYIVTDVPSSSTDIAAIAAAILRTLLPPVTSVESQTYIDEGQRGVAELRAERRPRLGAVRRFDNGSVGAWDGHGYREIDLTSALRLVDWIVAHDPGKREDESDLAWHDRLSEWHTVVLAAAQRIATHQRGAVHEIQHQCLKLLGEA